MIEATSGAWAPNAPLLLDHLARGIAATNCEDVEVASLRLAQRISIALRRTNVRAILKRAASLEVEDFGAWGSRWSHGGNTALIF